MTYGKEPFDLRLTMLCMCRRLPVILSVTLLGTVLFGGGYYVKNVLLRGQCYYTAASVYRVAYAVEEKDVGAVYINQTSWNTYLQSQMFLDAVYVHLRESLEDKADMIYEIPERQVLGEMLQAFLASDLRVPSTAVTTDNPEKSIWIAQAVEAAMTQEFAGAIREIASISVIDSGDTAQEVIPDVRVGRAFALSAVLSCFFAVVGVLLQITGEDGFRLPSAIWKRYGVKTAGTIESKELGENLRYFFRSEHGEGDFLKRVAVCGVQEQVDAAEVLDRLRQVCPDVTGAQEGDAGKDSGRGIDEGSGRSIGGDSGRSIDEGSGRSIDEDSGRGIDEGSGRGIDEDSRRNAGKDNGMDGWFAVPSPLLHPENSSLLRGAEGILLVVRAGAHGGRQFERVLEFLQQHDCKVTAAVLWEADEKLIWWYYKCERNEDFLRSESTRPKKI